ncbi:MAG: hypothetical protein ACRDOE_18370, partial [Streptosporangiaceae bacterium]
LTDWRQVMITGGFRAPGLTEALRHPAYAEWERKLASSRLICPQWPAAFGGQDMDAVRVAVLNAPSSASGRSACPGSRG